MSTVTMGETNTFKASLASKLISFFLVLCCMLVVYLCWLGLAVTQGTERMLLMVSSVFPVLVLIVATLRFAVISSRVIRITPEKLVHNQLFKNCTVGFASVLKLELLEDDEGNVDCIKVHDGRGGVIVDSRAVRDFGDLIELLKRRAPDASVVRVKEFASQG